MIWLSNADALGPANTDPMGLLLAGPIERPSGNTTYYLGTLRLAASRLVGGHQQTGWSR